jgi:outer membrane protein OmpA-like peptidoglycan-associated protein
MNTGISAAIAGASLLAPTIFVAFEVQLAKASLAEAEAKAEENPVPTASLSDDTYCTADLKKVLRRVLQSCGLEASGGRGCQPLEAKNVATLSGADFNALFLPLAQRAGIIQFEKESSELDATDLALLDQVYADEQGASYFFVVSRSSPEGSEVYNRQLSEKRGKAVFDYLKSTKNDSGLDGKVGLLWLGEEFAQLDEEFCTWQRSGAADTCQPEELNRSAFIAWIDCRL